MDERIVFESSLFGDENETSINDLEFCVDRIMMLPRIRPHKLDKAVRLSIMFCQKEDFCGKLLEKSNECPVLIYKLYKLGVFGFEQIKPILKNIKSFLLCYYFRNEINNFKSLIKNKDRPHNFEPSFFDNTVYIDQMIEYGFVPSSIEYCLKYDSIDDLHKFNIFNQKPKWSPFEWSIQPKYLDLLSFSGFFGSIKCFKHLLMEGFEINENVFSMVVCSGCFDLFHLCQGQQSITPNLVCKASEFFHLPLLVFMTENGLSIKTKPRFFCATPLHIAAENGHLGIVDFLFNQKADIEAMTKEITI